VQRTVLKPFVTRCSRPQSGTVDKAVRRIDNPQMDEEIAPNIRFRQARERAGLSQDDVAARCGVNSPSVWDIEGVDCELIECYSPREVQDFCRVLGIRPIELFADSISGPAVSAEELARLIHAECRARGVTLEQFEDAVGWRLSACMEPPEKLLEDMSVDGLQWLCREVRIDWRRVMLSL
jgi:DNA-binding XRE family transcriptional regulator